MYCDEEEGSYIADGLLGVACMTCLQDCCDRGSDVIDGKRAWRHLMWLGNTGRRGPFAEIFLDDGKMLGSVLAPFLVMFTGSLNRGASEVTQGDDDVEVLSVDEDAVASSVSGSGSADEHRGRRRPEPRIHAAFTQEHDLDGPDWSRLWWYTVNHRDQEAVGARMTAQLGVPLRQWQDWERRGIREQKLLEWERRERRGALLVARARPAEGRVEQSRVSGHAEAHFWSRERV